MTRATLDRVYDALSNLMSLMGEVCPSAGDSIEMSDAKGALYALEELIENTPSGKSIPVVLKDDDEEDQDTDAAFLDGYRTGRKESEADRASLQQEVDNLTSRLQASQQSWRHLRTRADLPSPNSGWAVALHKLTPTPVVTRVGSRPVDLLNDGYEYFMALPPRPRKEY